MLPSPMRVEAFQIQIAEDFGRVRQQCERNIDDVVEHITDLLQIEFDKMGKCVIKGRGRLFQQCEGKVDYVRKDTAHLLVTDNARMGECLRALNDFQKQIHEAATALENGGSKGKRGGAGRRRPKTARISTSNEGIGSTICGAWMKWRTRTSSFKCPS